jgi:hypothetical protein
MMGNNNTKEIVYLTDSLGNVVKDQYPSFYTQFQQDGGQPLEIVRGKSFDYEVFNMLALYYVGLLSDKAGATI